MDRTDEQSRALLAAIVDSSDDAIVSKDLNGIITSWNKAAETIFGYTADEAIGQPILMLIPPERQDEEPAILERIKKGQRLKHFETVRQTKSGRRIYISLTVSPIVTADGRIVGASKIVRDTSERYAERERIIQSEERYRTTLASIGDAVIATDGIGHITFMNRVAESLTGWVMASALGLPLTDVFNIVNEFTRKAVENPVAKVIREGGIVGLANHTILIAKDGTERPIDDSGAPIYGSDSRLGGVVLVFRDVSERRTAELNALRLAAIVQNSDDAIISKNLSGIITSWNSGAERIFGYTATEALGKSITMLIPSDVLYEEEEILRRLQKGERTYHFETSRIAKDGRQVAVSLTISPIKDSEGRVVGASKIARDITERKLSEQALLKAREELQQHAGNLEHLVQDRTVTLEKTVSELEAFSYSLSHDMRAPLRTIESFSQIILKDYAAKIGNEGEKLIHKVISAAQRMDKLIVDLLAFTRISRGPINIEAIDVLKLLRNIIHEQIDFQPPLAEINIIPPIPPVTGNETSLSQCITNLLGNAVKFVREGIKPCVRIHAEERGDRVCLWFEDNGIGIDADGKLRLFQMFQRIHGNSYPGTGIGLAIVRKAAERMDGTAGVESDAGKGSRFWLELPKGKL